VNNEKSRLAAHPEDYKLYRMGTFNDTSGLIIPEKQPFFITQLLSLVRPQGAVTK